MTTLNVQKRETKASRVRKEGFVTANLFGKEIKGSILLKVSQKDTEKLLKECGKCSQLFLNLDGKKYDVLLKEFGYDALTKKVIDIEFQALVKGEKVHSTAEIILVNENKNVDGVVEQVLKEVSYKATPENLVDRIEINCEGMKFGRTVRVSDLEIASNKNIELVTNKDALILTVIASGVTKEETAEEAKEAAAMQQACATTTNTK